MLSAREEIAFIINNNKRDPFFPKTADQSLFLGAYSHCAVYHKNSDIRLI